MGIKKAIAVAVAVRVKRNGVEVPVNSVRVTLAKSASLTWSIVILDPEIGMSEDFRPPKLKKGSTPAQTYSIDIYTLDGDHLLFTDLIPLSRQFSADPEGGYSVTISGVDWSKVLFFDNVTRATLKNDTALNMTKTLLGYGGITSWSLPPELDYPVAQMDIQRDRLINRIQTFLNEIGALWRMNGKQFVSWIPNPEAVPVYTFESGENIYTLNVTEDVIELYDKVTVTRVSKNAGTAAQSEGTDVGRKNVNLSGKFHQVQFQVVDDFGCTFSNIDWFFEEAYVGSGYNIIGPVDQVYFTVEGSGGATSFHWQIKVTGIPDSYLGTGIDINTEYEMTLPGEPGDNEAPRIESNFTPNNTVAELKAKAFLREQGSRSIQATFQAPIIDDLTLDDVITINEGVSYFSGDFNIESISYSVEGHEGYMELTVKRYET